jgi:hypothetical protein
VTPGLEDRFAQFQVVSMERFHEVLLEPGHGLRDLLARGSRGDEAPELRAVWTCQQADGDFLLDQRRQPGNQCWFNPAA